MYLFFSIFFFAALLCFLGNHYRKRRIRKKVCSMPETEKYELLNETIHPLGYQYLPRQDIFISSPDAWQREFGYTRSFDCFAPYLNMVFDSEPVYFDYDNRTWLVELWKGQYGINTGVEAAIYRADGIIPPKKRNKTLFHTIPDEELPFFSVDFKREEKEEIQTIATVSMTHWWLAAFRMGCFSRPKNLSAKLCIAFPNRQMTHAFADALIRLGYDARSLNLCDSCISFSFNAPKTQPPCRFFSGLMRHLAQLENRLFCQLYLMVTRPFCRTGDRLLYLYFYLPFFFRRCLRLRRREKHRHSRRTRNGSRLGEKE